MVHYQQWLESLFNRDEANGDWRWDIENEPLELQDQDSVEFFIRLTQEFPELLKKYNMWQISLGLEYLFNNSMSDFIISIRDGSAPIELRVEAILAIKKIYKQVFEPLCEPKLGHLSEEGNILNRFCYMLWDATPLSYCEDSLHKPILYEALSDVMNMAIQSDNIACIESGLHGLGHMRMYHPNCEKMIQAFISSGMCSEERVLNYADSALSGCIQ